MFTVNPWELRVDPTLCGGLSRTSCALSIDPTLRGNLELHVALRIDPTLRGGLALLVANVTNKPYPSRRSRTSCGERYE